MRVLNIPNKILASVNAAFLSLTTDFERIYVFNELTKSLASYKSADFTTSLVLAWFLIERFMETLWEIFLENENDDIGDNQKRINPERKRKLNDNRAYPVSVKLQILELNRILTFTQFKELDYLRDKRNKIVHPNKSSNIRSDPESCAKAFAFIEEYVKKNYNLELILNISYSHYGVYDR